MRYIFFITFILGINNTGFGQDPRDSIIGTYACEKYVEGTTKFFNDKLIITKDNDDSTKIFVYFVSDGGGRLMSYNKDSNNFFSPSFQDLEYGHFYNVDSIYLYRWLFSSQPDYYEYYGKRLKGGIGIYEQIINEYNLYPNPVQNKLYLDVFSSNMIAWKIYNMNGQTLKMGEIRGIKEIDVKELISGTYFLHLVDEYGSRTIKFIK